MKLLKIRPVSAELFHAEERTDRQTVNDGAKSHFSQTCEHTFKHCTIMDMFPKLFEASSDYFPQTLLKFVFEMGGKYIRGGGQKLNNYSSDSFRFSKR
jgi:hypothetical protein